MCSEEITVTASAAGPLGDVTKITKCLNDENFPPHSRQGSLDTWSTERQIGRVLDSEGSRLNHFGH